MTHPVFQHDQTVAYIKNDAMFVRVDEQNSYEAIANIFEMYWRSIIVEELNINLPVIEQVHGKIPQNIRREILKLVWETR
jgi:uncharacterized protein YjaG (DUF416 family)